MRIDLGVRAELGLVDCPVIDRPRDPRHPVEPLALLGSMKLGVDHVVANLEPGRGPHVEPGQCVRPRQSQVRADLGARVVLFDLRPVLHPRRLKRRRDPVVRKELEGRVDRVNRRFDVAALDLASIRRQRHVPLGRPPLARIHRVPAAQAMRSCVGPGGRRPIPLAADGARGEMRRPRHKPMSRCTPSA